MSITLATSTMCLAWATMTSGGDEPEKVALAYTFRTEEPLRYEMMRTSVMSQLMGEQLSMMEERIISDVTREQIGKTDDGALIMRQITNSFTMKESTPAGEFMFDSENEEDQDKRTDERVRGIYESLGWEIDYVISPKGEVLRVENLEALEEKIDAMSEEQIRAELEEALSLDTLIQDVNPFMHLLPEQEVGIDDTWVSSFTIIDDGMTMTATQQMLVESLLDWKDGHYVGVKFEGDVDMQLPPEFPPFMALTKSTISGNFIFNTHYGAVSDYKSTIRLVFSGTPGPGMDNISLVIGLHMEYELQQD